MNQTIVPGTFHELNDKQKAAIRYSLVLGLDIQKTFPTIAEDYRNGESLSEIVKKYDINNLFGIKKSTARQSVTYALRGYREDWDMFPDIVYRGLLSIEEYNRLAREHHEESGERLGNQHGHNSGMKTFRDGTGVHALVYTEKHDVGQKGIVKQGHIPWSDEEILTLEELSQNPTYQRRSRIHAQNIAEEINRIFHTRNSVRDNTSVKKAFNRYKNRFEEFKQR